MALPYHPHLANFSDGIGLKVPYIEIIDITRGSTQAMMGPIQKLPTSGFPILQVSKITLPPTIGTYM